MLKNASRNKCNRDYKITIDKRFIKCNNRYNKMETMLIIGIIVSGFVVGWNLGIILSSLIFMCCKKYRR